jgi:hypothetical protein
MVMARLLRWAGAVIGFVLPTVVVPTSAIDAVALDGAAPGVVHGAVHGVVHGAVLSAVGRGAFEASTLPRETRAAAVSFDDDDRVLTLAVSVRGRRIRDADDPLPRVPAGEPVDVAYKVHNDTLFPVSDVLVSDPAVGEGAVTCPGGGPTIAYVPALSSVNCFASVPAVPGRHDGTVRVIGRQTILLVQVPVAAHARVGYVGLEPSPSPSPPVTVTPHSPPAPPPPPKPTPERPRPVAVPVRVAPSPTPTRSTAPPSPSPPASPSPLYHPVAAPVPAKPPQPGVPTPLFVLIMAMPAAAGAAVAFGRRAR